MNLCCEDSLIVEHDFSNDLMPYATIFFQVWQDHVGICSSRWVQNILYPHQVLMLLGWD